MSSTILCVGESIIDFISLDSGKSLSEVTTFSKQPGGSSSNVAFGLAKLNIPVAFSGIIGADYFGEFLENFLVSNNIDCGLLKKTDKFNMSIVFVGLDESGKNNFFFYRDFGLNKEYKITKNDYSRLRTAKIIHFSSVVLRQTNFKYQLIKLIDYVKFKNRGLVHFDANIRFALWDNQNVLKNVVIQFIRLADIIKFSEDELYFISEHKDIEYSLRNCKLLKNKFVIVTAGGSGAYTLFDNEFIHLPTFRVNAVDTTGAGDAFVSGFLSRLYKANIDNISALESISKGDLIEWLTFANAAGALNCTKHGATAGMASEKNILSFIKHNEKY